MFVLRAPARHEEIAFPVTSHRSELSTDESLLQKRPNGRRLSVKQQLPSCTHAKSHQIQV